MLIIVNVCNTYLSPQFNICAFLFCQPGASRSVLEKMMDPEVSQTVIYKSLNTHTGSSGWQISVGLVASSTWMHNHPYFVCLFVNFLVQGIKRQGSSCALPFCHPCLLDSRSLLAFYRQPPWGRCFRMCFPLLTLRIFGSEICQRKDLKDNKLFASSFAELFFLAQTTTN